jgi:hypothetical protein
MGCGSWGFGFVPVAAIARTDAGDAVATVRPIEEGLRCNIPFCLRSSTR